MEIKQLAKKYKDSRLNQAKGIFAQLNIIQNLLQTTFDKTYGVVTLKQFMLMIMVKQSTEFNEELTLTDYGRLLGCSRQNIKKLAIQLEIKNFVTVKQSKHDPRALAIESRKELHKYFKEVNQENNEILLKLFSIYNDKELGMLYKLLDKLHEGIELINEK